MPNYGLLTSAAQVPMSGVPFKMNTPDENQAIHYGMEGRKLAVEQGQQEFAQGNQDRDILKQALAVPENDLATPEGTQNLMGAVKGKVSPERYSALADHAEKIKATHLKNQQMLLQMPGDVLDLQARQMEALAPALDQGLREYEKNKSEKGEVYAAQQQREFMGNLFTHTKGMKQPNGQPLYPDELVNSLKDMDPAHMDSVLRGTRYMAEQTKQAYEQARATDLESKIKEREAAMKGGQEYQDKQGGLWMLTTTGIPMRMNPLTQQYEVSPNGAFPDIKTLTPIGGKAGQGGGGAPTVLRSLSTGDTYTLNKDGTFLHRDAKTGAEQTVVTPAEDAVKAGTAPKSKQLEFSPETAHSIAMSMAMGETKPTRLTPAQNTQLFEAQNDIRKMAGLSSSDFANIQTNNKLRRTAIRNIENTMGQVEGFEKLVTYNSNKIKELLPQATNTDIPLLTKLILEGKGQFSGVGTANAQLAIAIDSLLKEYTKITSGSMGNQVLAEGEINKARQLINAARSKEDLLAVVDYFQQEAKIGRIGGLRAQRDSMVSSLSEPFKDVKEPPSNPGKISPAQQAENDKDQPKIYQAEYDRMVGELKSITDPAARKRKLDDIKAVRSEAAKVGLKLPEPGETAAPEKTKSGATVSNW